MRVALPVAGPEHEEGDHDDAAAHTEQAGKKTAEDADREQPSVKPGEASSRGGTSTATDARSLIV